jgi:rod shape-determining protein MreC
VESLETDLRNLPEVQREYEELVELVGEKTWKQGKTLGARVIGGQTSNLEASRLLNKGASDGVKVGMAVVSGEGLVGRISFTAPRYSKVLLVNDPRHAVGARLVNSGETGVLIGRNEEDLLLDLISPEVTVAVGETVVTSGYDRGIYPAGIPIGRVTKISVSRDRLSKTSLVRPYVNFGKLDIILVLMESGELVGPNG